MALPLGSDAETLGQNNSGGMVIGATAAKKVAFYGATTVAQRAYSSAVHATSAQASSASFGATQLATLQEIQLTMIGLGICSTA